jgi:hypothetical protein
LQPYAESLHQTSHNTTERVTMVLMASKVSRRIFELINENAESVGEIRQPLQPAMIGFGRGTVYLDRTIPLVKPVEPAA